MAACRTVAMTCCPWSRIRIPTSHRPDALARQVPDTKKRVGQRIARPLRAGHIKA
jgi:hypothetical protein